MIENIRNTLLAGLGAASFSKEKLQTVLDDLVRRGDLTREQGKKLLDELLEKGRSESRSAADKVAKEIARLIDKSPFVSRREFNRLVDRVRSLEVKLGAEAPEEVEPAEESSPTGGGEGTEEPRE